MLNKILFTLAVTLIASTASAAQKTYELKGEAPVGSRIKPVEATSPIPFNKPYSKLTEEQKTLVNSSYDNLATGDTPPFPAKGTKAIYKPIIKGHKKSPKPGKLIVSAMVDEQGRVVDVTVHESPSERMSDLATRVFNNTRFDAASCSGRPCRMEYNFELAFK